MRCRRSAAAPLLLVLLAGCAGGEGATDSTSTAAAEQATVADPPPPRSSGGSTVTPPPCPPDSSNCERASGRILYVERVDPDGDGDAHFVLVSDESITAPGVSVIDVRADLRPDPLPGPGDELAASGPVYRGSYGQRQIQADRVAVGEATP